MTRPVVPVPFRKARPARGCPPVQVVPLGVPPRLVKDPATYILFPAEAAAGAMTETVLSAQGFQAAALTGVATVSAAIWLRDTPAMVVKSPPANTVVASDDTARARTLKLALGSQEVGIPVE